MPNVNQTFARIGLKQIQEESLMDISRNRSELDMMEAENLTPGKLCKTYSYESDEQKSYNSPGIRALRDQGSIIGGRRSLTHTPIKNSFFSESNTTNQSTTTIAQSEHNKENINKTPYTKSIFRIQRLGSNHNLEGANKENIEINKSPYTVPITTEEKRQRYEEQMRKELTGINNEGQISLQEKEMYNQCAQDLQDSELRKLELRRKFEEEMEQEMMQMSMTSINGNEM